MAGGSAHLPETEEAGAAGPALVYARRARPGRYVSALVVLVIAVTIVNIFASSPAMRWTVFAQYFFDPRILEGVGKTLLLTFVAMVLSTILGVILAIMRRSEDPTLRAAAWLYINFMRSVPLLVLILFTYFLAVLLPQLSLGIPFTDITFFSVSTNAMISPFTASILALGLGQAAYTSEIVRGGIMAVDRGQMEAATALGMPPGRSMRRVILPQAFRVIVPGLGNETIGMLKATSLVQIIGYTELLTTAQRIYALNFETIPLLLVVTVWYLVLTTLATLGQIQLERIMNRGF
jgi:polar amino acid transport system permease protein